MNAEEYKKLEAPASFVDFSAAVTDKDPQYKSVEWASRLLMTFGAALATVGVAYSCWNRVGATLNPQPSPLPRISLREILMIYVLSVVFAGLGVVLRTAYNGMRTKLLLETLTLQGERNSHLHAERMAIIKSDIKPAADSGKVQAAALPVEMALLFSNKPG